MITKVLVVAFVDDVNITGAKIDVMDKFYTDMDVLNLKDLHFSSYKGCMYYSVMLGASRSIKSITLFGCSTSIASFILVVSVFLLNLRGNAPLSHKIKEWHI